MTLHQAGLCAGAYHLRLEHHPAAERPSSLGVGVARERPVVEGQETKVGITKEYPNIADNAERHTHMCTLTPIDTGWCNHGL